MTVGLTLVAVGAVIAWVLLTLAGLICEAHALHDTTEKLMPKDRILPNTAFCPDFDLRGQTYEIWTDPMNPSNRCLVDPRKNHVVDTDHAFDPPLSNEELLSIYDYGKGY